MAVWNKRTTEEIRNLVEKVGYYLLENRIVKNVTKVIIRDEVGYKYDVLFQHLIDLRKIKTVEEGIKHILEEIE